MQVRETLKRRTKRAIDDIAETCYDIMSTDLGKCRILNPSDRPPILHLPLKSQSEIHEVIITLVSQYFDRFLRYSNVLKKFKEIREEIVSFYHNTSLELSKMENEWIYDRESEALVCEALVTTSLYLPEFTIEVAVPTVNWLRSLLPRGSKDRKRKLIDESYNKCMSSIRSSVCNLFDLSYGFVVMDLLNKVTNDLLPKRINCLKKIIIEQSMDAQQKKLGNHQPLQHLANNVKILQESAIELEESLGYVLDDNVVEANNGML